MNRNVIRCLFSMMLVVITSAAHASPMRPPWFELYNKSNVDIRISVSAFLENKFSYFSEDSIISPNERYEIKKPIPNDTKSILLSVQYRDERTGDASDVKCHQQIFIFAEQSKCYDTIYLSFDTKKNPKLYPQTGSWWGLLGTTSSGYSLKENIRSRNIVSGTPEILDEEECGFPMRHDD